MSFENIFQEGLLVRLHIKQWSGQVQLSPEDLDIDSQAVEHPKYKFILGKKYLIPKEETDVIRAIELRGRRVITGSSFVFPIGDLPFVPASLITEVIAGLDTVKGEFLAAVDNLCVRYQTIAHESLRSYIEVAKKIWEVGRKSKLEQEFADSFVARIRTAFPGPKKLRSKYGFDYSIFSISAPGNQGSTAELIDTAVAKQCRKELEAQTRQFLEDVVQELRQRTVDTFTEVSSKIANGQIVSEATMNTLRTFIDGYERLNFVGDRGISKTLADFRNQWLNQDAKGIRERSELQGEFTQALDQVARRASELTDISKVTGRIKRKLDL